MNFSLLTLAAALSAGISIMALTLFLADLLQKVEVEKTEKTEEAKRLPVIFRLFMPFVPNVLPLVRADFFSRMLAQSRSLLSMAGFDLTISPEQFLSVRILMGICGIFFFVLMFLADKALMGLLLALLFFMYPTVWLKGVVRRRHLEMLKALPNLLDLLTLSVEAGKDFLTALRDILLRRKMDALSEEFGRAMHEIQLGKQRQSALKEMALRVQLPELTSIVNAIIQADELGVSIGQLLRIQGDQLRGKRFVRAEKLANEAPVKILFPVVIFIFPAVFIILMGPILMQAMKTLVQ